MELTPAGEVLMAKVNVPKLLLSILLPEEEMVATNKEPETGPETVIPPGSLHRREDEEIQVDLPPVSSAVPDTRIPAEEALPGLLSKLETPKTVTDMLPVAPPLLLTAPLTSAPSILTPLVIVPAPPARPLPPITTISWLSR